MIAGAVVAAMLPEISYYGIYANLSIEKTNFAWIKINFAQFKIKRKSSKLWAGSRKVHIICLALKINYTMCLYVLWIYCSFSNARRIMSKMSLINHSNSVKATPQANLRCKTNLQLGFCMLFFMSSSFLKHLFFANSNHIVKKLKLWKRIHMTNMQNTCMQIFS